MRARLQTAPGKRKGGTHDPVHRGLQKARYVTVSHLGDQTGLPFFSVPLVVYKRGYNLLRGDAGRAARSVTGS
jgi:hypothetical protein